MPGAAGLEKKQEYIKKLFRLLNTYTKILTVGADMVTSNQVQLVRQALRGKGELLMGKNTLVRKGIRDFLATNPSSAIERVLPSIKFNVGLIFTNEEPATIRSIIDTKRVAAPARVGVLAPNDVVIPKQQTSLEPTQTTFFQALGVATKINKGSIEIINDVNLLKKGDKVQASHSALLSKLNIKPFTYGLEISSIYDNGAVYAPRVLDITKDDIVESFSAAIAKIAAVGLEVGFPTLASLPYSINNSFKNVLAVAVEVDYEIPQLKALKAAASAAPAQAAAAPAAAAAKAPEPAKEKSEEEDMGLSLFD